MPIIENSALLRVLIGYPKFADSHQYANFQVLDMSVSTEVPGWTEVQRGDHVQSSMFTFAMQMVGI